MAYGGLMKRCSKCKTEKQSGEFCGDRSRKDGLNSWCRPCANTRYRENYSSKPMTDGTWKARRIHECRQKLVHWQRELSRLLNEPIRDSLEFKKFDPQPFAELPKGLDLANN